MCLEQGCASAPAWIPWTTLCSALAWKYLLIADDLTSASLCVTAAEIGLTCGPAFYPEIFSRVYKIVALGARFFTYTLSYIPHLSFSCGYVRVLYSSFEYSLHNVENTGKQGQKLISLSIM